MIIIRKIKTAVDFIMIMIFLTLMSYTLVRENIHEYFGLSCFVLVVLHHLLNFRWHKSVFRGKYNPLRITETIVNILLAVLLFSSVISGILMSKYVFNFLDININLDIIRKIHIISVYWFFVSVSFHFGLRINIIKSFFRKNIHIKNNEIVLIIKILIFAYGVYAVYKRNIISYMFLRSYFVFFNFEEPIVLFFLDYAAIMIMFILSGEFVSYLLKKLNIRKR